MLKPTVAVALVSALLTVSCRPSADDSTEVALPPTAGSDPASTVAVAPAEAGLQSIDVNGVKLHYVDSGPVQEGSPAIVFVHGSLSDYREWEPVADALAGEYRTIRYSRRYNHPNENAPGKDHSAAVEAEDLAALIGGLNLGAAHVVGVSYGGYTGLFLALNHPQSLASLVVVEPPLIKMLPELAEGQAIYDGFQEELWKPASAAAMSGDDEQALRITMDFFAGPGALDGMPPFVQDILRSNYPEWRTLLLSADAFPLLPREGLETLNVPVLMLTGENTYPIAQLVDPALEQILPDVKRSIIPAGTHEMCSESPPACADAIGEFLKSRSSAP